MKYILFFSLFFLFFTSCSKEFTCDNLIAGQGRFVAYEVAKHSHVWIENLDTKEIKKIGNIGGRRIPIPDLGDTINIKYCEEDGEIFFNQKEYITIPKDRSTRFLALRGYYEILKPE